MPVTVTETAAREIKRIVNDEKLNPESVRLRVGVKGGGCSGFNYILDLTENQRETDEVWEYTYALRPLAAPPSLLSGRGGVATAGNGEPETFILKVICDPKSYLYLNGTEIDFKEEIMGRGFTFRNPNATSSCGCGASFAV